jgi:hypothetical protein
MIKELVITAKTLKLKIKDKNSKEKKIKLLTLNNILK